MFGLVSELVVKVLVVVNSEGSLEVFFCGLKQFCRGLCRLYRRFRCASSSSNLYRKGKYDSRTSVHRSSLLSTKKVLESCRTMLQWLGSFDKNVFIDIKFLSVYCVRCHFVNHSMAIIIFPCSYPNNVIMVLFSHKL